MNINESHQQTMRGRPRTGLRRFLNRFSRDECGATSIEYGLICSLIFLAITVGVGNFSNATINMYNKIENKL